MKNPLTEARETMLQIQARLGWIDTRPERAFWAMVRFLRLNRKPALALILVVTSQAQSPAPTPVPAGTPVADSMNLANNIYQFSAQGIRDRIAQLWKESQDQARWVTDLVQSYRNIRMAKSAYESIATFDLAQNVNLIDLIPQIDLAEGQYFGGEENGFSERGGNSQYVSLRFKLNPSGGIAKTLNFSNLAKFRPKLRVDVDQLASQLANLDFDAVQMIQYRGPNGEPKGTPINVGRAVSARLALWDDILKSANDYLGQRQREQDSYSALQEQIARENQAFQLTVRGLQDRADKEDNELRMRLAGKSVPPDLPATYDMIYSPRVQLARGILAADQVRYKENLSALWGRLTAIKQTEERRQAAVQGDAQVTEILAEAARVQQAMQTAFDQILQKYKVKRNDPGEKIGGGLLPSLTLSSKDLADMKLPPPAQQEVERLMSATSQSLQVLQIKLQGQKYMAEHMQTINGVTKDLSDATNALSSAFSNRASAELTNLARNMKALDDQRLEQWRLREEQNRQDSAQNAQKIWEAFSDANQRYFKYMMTNKPVSAGALVENLGKSYFQLVKTFTGGRSLGDVMGARFNTGKVDFQKEMELYNSFGFNSSEANGF